jgi:VanZ family protein
MSFGLNRFRTYDIGHSIYRGNMTFKGVTKVCCVTALVLIAFFGLGPQAWQPRSGLGWEMDHFIGYFIITSMFCLAWPRPMMVAAGLVVFAVLLEALQAIPPDRHSNLQAAFISAGGVIAAALVAELLIRLWRWRRQAEAR